jgi:hypothetical protein
MVRLPFANYTPEQTLFQELVHGDGSRNILLLHGESGSGKSHLISHCLQALKDVPAALMRLHSGNETVPTLFSLMGHQCGWANLPHFIRTVAALIEQPDQVNDPVWQMGMHRHLEEIGKISDLESRLSRYQLLGDAWFADIMAFNTSFLLAVDAYENVSTLFDRWFSQDFLARVASLRQMRVVVSGKRVPEPHEAWSFRANWHKLKGVNETNDWVAWANQSGYHIPPEEEKWVKGVVDALNGNPSQITQIIEAKAPRSNSPPKTNEFEQKQNRLLRRNMINAFSLEELRGICFDLSIDYENLPNHGQKDSLVRELIALMQRNGRLDELIHVLQAERPHLEWQAHGE